VALEGPRAWNLRDALSAEAPTLLASARLITLNEADAWDLVQATLEIGLRQGGTLREPRALRAWLLAILNHEASRWRHRARRTLSLDHIEMQLPTDTIPDANRVFVRQGLARLPTKMRTAVVLHHMAGLSIAEVASAMHVSENTVKSQVRIGVSRLREVFSDEST
jgi:RNA polymerase sigma factor (sigma-70 family)